MVQTVMVLIVVGLAAAYIACIFYKKVRPGKSGACDCGCAACSPGIDLKSAAGGRCGAEADKSKIKNLKSKIKSRTL